MFVEFSCNSSFLSQYGSIQRMCLMEIFWVFGGLLDKIVEITTLSLIIKFLVFIIVSDLVGHRLFLIRMVTHLQFPGVEGFKSSNWRWGLCPGGFSPPVVASASAARHCEQGQDSLWKDTRSSWQIYFLGIRWISLFSLSLHLSTSVLWLILTYSWFGLMIDQLGYCSLVLGYP